METHDAPSGAQHRTAALENSSRQCLSGIACERIAPPSPAASTERGQASMACAYGCVGHSGCGGGGCGGGGGSGSGGGGGKGSGSGGGGGGGGGGGKVVQ